MKKYSLKELKDLLKITDSQWKRRKEDILDHLHDYFDYEVKITNDHNYVFIIYQQLRGYEPLPRKTNPEKREYYAKLTRAYIEEKPHNTGTNIARNIKHKEQEMDRDEVDTIARYTCRVVRDEYEPTSGENIWCYLNDDKLEYIPLDEEEVEWLKNAFYIKCASRENTLGEIYSQRINKIITERQAIEKQKECNEQFFVGIFKAFRDRFKKWPISVPKWQVKTKDSFFFG